MLTGEAPEVHLAEVGQRDGLGCAPKEIKRALEAQRAIGLEKLDPQEQPNQEI
jgi:hypothetical protein